MPPVHCCPAYSSLSAHVWQWPGPADPVTMCGNTGRESSVHMAIQLQLHCGGGGENGTPDPPGMCDTKALAGRGPTASRPWLWTQSRAAESDLQGSRPGRPVPRLTSGQGLPAPRGHQNAVVWGPAPPSSSTWFASDRHSGQRKPSQGTLPEPAGGASHLEIRVAGQELG